MLRKDIFDLSGRVALVTGASSYGIGSVSAKVLAANGAKVFLTARREDKLAEVAAEIEEAGGEAGYIACDVSSEEQCKAAVEACISKFGRLDIMVLSAGISGLPTRGDMNMVFDSDNWRNVQGINLDGVFWMMKYGWEECAKNGVGAIIPVASLAAWTADGSAAYTATKGAIRSLTHNLASALAPHKVRVNTIYPGLIDTDMTHGMMAYPQLVEQFQAKIPLGRFGEPEDIAYGILFLASDASSFMTGQHLIMDGGQLC